MPRGKRIRCEVCRNEVRQAPFAACAGCIKRLISQFRASRPKRPRTKKEDPIIVEVNMNACDACGLKRDTENFRSHNCFEVIKQIGRVELAIHLLQRIEKLPDDKALTVLKDLLILERVNRPEIEPTQELTATA